MLNKQEVPARFEDAAHFVERTACIRNGAQCPGRHNRIDTRILERNLLGRTFDQVHGKALGSDMSRQVQ